MKNQSFNSGSNEWFLKINPMLPYNVIFFTLQSNTKSKSKNSTNSQHVTKSNCNPITGFRVIDISELQNYGARQSERRSGKRILFRTRLRKLYYNFYLFESHSHLPDNRRFLNTFTSQTRAKQIMKSRNSYFQC